MTKGETLDLVMAVVLGLCTAYVITYIAIPFWNLLVRDGVIR